MKRGGKMRARALVMEQLLRQDTALVVLRPTLELTEDLIEVCVKHEAADRVVLNQDPKVVRQLEEVKPNGSPSS